MHIAMIFQGPRLLSGSLGNQRRKAVQREAALNFVNLSPWSMGESQSRTECLEKIDQVKQN